MYADVRQQLTMARDAYLAALEHRNSVTPGTPAFVDAVFDTSLRFAQMHYWEKRLIDLRLNEPLLADAVAV